MTELLTAAQMRAIEQAAIESGEVTGLELMERAGQGVVDAIFEEWPELSKGKRRSVVLCGPGNNGGDGFVVARLLKEAGWAVEVFLYGDPEKLPPDARMNYDRWLEIEDVVRLKDAAFDGGFDDDAAPDIYIDALFGTGLTRAFLDLPKLQMTLNTAHSYWLSQGKGARVVAIDIPSGLCADSGRWLGDDQPYDFAGLAHLTVSFHRPKSGHFLADGPWSCGSLRHREIGLPAAWRATRQLTWNDIVFAAERPEGIDVWHLSKNKLSGKAHKYSHGHALILSGGVGKGGAARLAARGALRVGAGAVTVGAPLAALAENAAELNAIMLTAVKDADGLTGILEDDRINALCIGPGLGRSEESAGLVEAGLMSGRAIVLDADALTLIGRDASLFAALHEKCVLTPHAGEFARLFPDIAETLNAPATTGPAYSKVDATREAAKRAGCVVLFKGPDTVIADSSGRCAINASVYERAAPWLATAGSGDVLAGFITGLLARGFHPMQAAETGAWLHTECALSFGPGLIAEDLPEELPNVFRKLGL
ncbi:NAD(P)H-hydrate dehydratase [Cognatiyoonia sp. IB215182]|uniref:NAD(P)H-hydrate dehydratase n=1 Tax=Cognatiyoonia sp. IB215182 TaxID=3097353 RepID=UPI002A121D7A|nr:NAD(P)H-hydrate dehydratase [Cognatiyoonia sp. IB215182]MDX8352240.1 NAD(P)H-hydrate dehydratase [Cognatiyoonia sp. IB215182]